MLGWVKLEHFGNFKQSLYSMQWRGGAKDLRKDSALVIKQAISAEDMAEIGSLQVACLKTY